jgi:hypothetical protein
MAADIDAQSTEQELPMVSGLTTSTDSLSGTSSYGDEQVEII